MKENIYIFGAHSRSRTLGVYLSKLHPEFHILAYLVDNEEQNEAYVGDVPVLNLADKPQLATEAAVYIGTRGVYHEKITAELRELGFANIIPITPDLDMHLRNDYLDIYYAERGRNFDKLNKHSAYKLYVIKSAFDSSLQESYDLKTYEQELQVGAALSDIKVADLTDDTGYEISRRNRQFCELTGLYWIWKNSKEDIVGLEHYRRHFILPDDWGEKMMLNNIDVILPTPLCVSPSLGQNYRDRHVASDWEYMMKFLKELYPEDYDAAVEFFEHTELYSPCNMFIMRKQVLNILCSWMFPILFACADHLGEREDAYQNRYPGFLAERLITFYFEKHKEDYRIVYADKDFRK